MSKLKKEQTESTAQSTTSELLRTQMNAEENQPKGEYLIERIPHPGTPFIYIKDNEGWFITMGKYRLTEKTENREVLEAMVEDKDWSIIISVMSAMYSVALEEAKK